MNDMNEVDQVARLLGAVSSQLNQIDSQIISESANLKRGSWNPRNILKRHIQSQGHVVSSTPPDRPVERQQIPQPITNTVIERVDSPASPPQSVNFIDANTEAKLTRIESDVAKILEKLSNISSINTNIESSIEKMLKNKAKQITIKFDESKDRRSE